MTLNRNALKPRAHFLRSAVTTISNPAGKSLHHMYPSCIAQGTCNEAGRTRRHGWDRTPIDCTFTPDDPCPSYCANRSRLSSNTLGHRTARQALEGSLPLLHPMDCKMAYLERQPVLSSEHCCRCTHLKAAPNEMTVPHPNQHVASSKSHGQSM